MRARDRWLTGLALAVLAAAVGTSIAVFGAGDDASETEPADAATEFVAAWERSRTATFVATGTWERRSVATGSELTSEAYLAQDPPRRLQEEQGGVQGRVDDRLLLCPSGPDDAAAACALGPPTGVAYAESVDAEVEALATLVEGPDRLYDVTADGGCFTLTQQRVEPRAPYGTSATFCFDAATGAPARREVRFERGIVERVVYDEIRAEVTSDDLRP